MAIFDLWSRIVAVRSVIRASLYASWVIATAAVGACQKETATGRQEILRTTTHEIWAVFRENEIAAEALYAGKDLRVTGTVGGVELEGTGRPIVLLVSRDDEFPMRAQLAQSAVEKTTDLNEGDRMVFRCGGVTQFAQAPMLLNCTF